jgi:hypothetical protein
MAWGSVVSTTLRPELIAESQASLVLVEGLTLPHLFGGIQVFPQRKDYVPGLKFSLGDFGERLD